jgi:hypothetical protein
MTSLGGVNRVVVMDTEPEAIVPEPRESVPLVKVIVPVTPEGTDAVIVTEPPNVLGLGVVDTVTVVVALLTTWTTTLDVSVLYCAVILCPPAASVEVVNTAAPPEIAAEPMVVAPSRKVTVPVLLGSTVAVKVTDWPKVEGFSEELNTTVATVIGTTLEVLGL